MVETRDRICSRIGYSKMNRVDQRSESISRDIDLWAYQRGVTLDFSRPVMPSDDADAPDKVEAWRRDYNE